MTPRNFTRIDALFNGMEPRYTGSGYPRRQGAYLDVAGFHETPTWLCAAATRCAFESWGKSTPEADFNLLHRMIDSGPEHEKSLRGKLYFLAIEAPRYWWAEMDTYTVGVIPMGSTSTMHAEANGLTGDELVAVKSALPEGTLQLRIRAFSHPTLRRIIAQRAKHRLPEWREFCAFAQTLLPL